MATLGVAIAVSLASGLVQSALTPTPKAQNNIDDVSVLKAEFGVNIPFIKGVFRVTGNIFWARDNEIAKVGSSGGKGSGGGGNRRYVAFGTFAFVLAEGTATAIGKIWFNNELVYHPFSSDPDVAAESAAFAAAHLTFYYGNVGQAPDPLIESIEGVGNVPNFAGKIYIVVRDLNLEKYGNSVPKPEVEVWTEPNRSETTVGDLLEALLAKSTIPVANYSIHPDLYLINYYGFYFAQSGNTIREAIEDCQNITQFIVVDTGFQIEFKPFNRVSTIQVESEFLRTTTDGKAIPRFSGKDSKEEDVSSEVEVEFKNWYKNYERGIQQAYNASVSHENTGNFRTNVVLDDSRAATAVTKLLELAARQSKKFQEIFLPIDYFYVKAGDILNVEVRGTPTKLQIEKLVKSSNYILKAETVSYDDLIPNIVVTTPTTQDYNPVETIPLVSNPDTLAIDTNLATDSHTDYGLYASPLPRPNFSWGFGGLFGSLNGGTFNFITVLDFVGAIGTLQSTLEISSFNTVDTTSSFDILLDFGIVENVPESSFYNFEQILYIDGELIAFQNATLTGGSNYTIDTLVRGVRGTEHEIKQHAIGTPVYLILGNESFTNAEANSSIVNQDISLKSVPDTFTITSVTNTADFTNFQNKRTIPYSPVHAKLTKDNPTSNLIITWERRTRRFGQWNPNTEIVPLEEAFELYDLEIYNGATLVRSLTQLNTKSYVYTSADQVTDFGTNPTQISVKIYQLSAIAGRGYEFSDTITISTINV